MILTLAIYGTFEKLFLVTDDRCDTCFLYFFFIIIIY